MPVWAIIFIVITLISLLILGIVFYYIYRKQDQDLKKPTPSDFTLTAVYGWSGQNGPDPYKNFCQIYNVSPPTFQKDVLDNIPGITEQPCYYADQIIATQLQRTCIDKNVDIGPTGTTVIFNLCRRTDGTLAQPGDTEVYYDNSVCANIINPCPGSLGIIAVPFSDLSGNIIQSCVLGPTGLTGPGYLPIVPCNINDRNQHFSLTNYSLGLTGVYQDNSGPFAQLVLRNTPVGYVGPQVCLAEVKDFTLGVTSCSPTNPEWIFVPSFQAFVPGITFIPGTTGTTLIFPQGLVSTRNIDITNIPQFNTGQDIYNYLASINANALTVNLTPNGFGQHVYALSYRDAAINLQTYNLDKGTNYNVVSSINTQFVNYDLYNFIMQNNPPIQQPLS